MTNERRIFEIEARVQQLEQALARLPLRDIGPPPPPKRVQVIGGQLVNGYPLIQYAADPLTADKAYNPLTDTIYIAGLGYGVLFSSRGQPAGQVIIRHNFAGYQQSLAVGNVYLVTGATTIPVAGGGTIRVYPVIGSA